MNNRIIKDYLESLKEDDELDYIFPILLESMGFQILSSPKISKGQPQYGKDIVAIGDDENGIKHKWYFELKGNAAKDITDTNFFKPDGVRDSILAAKDVPYQDASIPGLENLPTKIVFVHNGRLHENTRAILTNLVSREFKEGEFERWDIDKLTFLFQKYLFDECLFRDWECYKLIKRILVQHDAPGWTTRDIDQLIEHLLKACPVRKSNSRMLELTISSMALMVFMLFSEGKENGNISSAKKSIDRVVLLTWAWIIENNLETSKQILKKYFSLIELQLKIYDAYFEKLLPLAVQYKGLYMYNGMTTEKVCYPLRCFEFINDFMYYCILKFRFVQKEDIPKFYCESLEAIFQVMGKNSGFTMPLFDTHYLTYTLLFKLIMLWGQNGEKDWLRFGKIISETVQNLFLRKKDSDMLPELYNNRKELARSLYKKSDGYTDSSSILLLRMLEFVSVMGMEDHYQLLSELIEQNHIVIQDCYPIPSEDFEVKLFRQRMYDGFSVKTPINIPPTMDEFIKQHRRDISTVSLKTSLSPYSFLTIMAHLHYQTDWFPEFLDLGFLNGNEDNQRINPSDCCEI
ncbi:MAG: hypothetical protein K2G90_10550 [Muribaculaceae bacterium]|nr:hypothetical protein [Muribaculaceae bacterium]